MPKPMKKTVPTFDMFAACKNDRDKLIRYLAHNDHITRVAAMSLFRIHNVTARISELKKIGWTINTERCKDVTGKAYARWSLSGYDRDYVQGIVQREQDEYNAAQSNPVAA